MPARACRCREVGSRGKSCPGIGSIWRRRLPGCGGCITRGAVAGWYVWGVGAIVILIGLIRLKPAGRLQLASRQAAE